MTDEDMGYFTAVEEHFQRARRAPFFRLSASDWNLIESWKNAGIPLDAILRAIDRTFSAWNAQRSRARIEKINSLAYCTHNVLAEASSNMATNTRLKIRPLFSLADITHFVRRNAQSLRERGHYDFATALDSIDVAALWTDPEQLERQLTAIEEQLIAHLQTNTPAEVLRDARSHVDQQSKPYREKVSLEQLALLEKQFLERQLLHAARLPRLSIFYFQPARTDWPRSC